MVERIIKVIAIIIIATLAVIGLIYDFKTPNGELNRWGQIALTLTVLSGFTAIILEFWSHRREKKAASEEKENDEKQKNLLSEIKKGIRSIDLPLLPARFLITLKVPINEADAEQIANLPNFLESDTLKFMLENLPTPDEQFRLQVPNGYFDVSDGKVVSAGAYSMQHPGINLIHENVEHTFMRISAEDVQKVIKDKLIPRDLLNMPASFEANIAFNDAGRSSEKSNLKLIGETDGFQPVGLTVIDDYFYVNWILSTKEVVMTDEINWGFSDLKNSKISAKIGYLLIHGLGVDREIKARGTTIHDFQIMSGDDARAIFAFSEEMLSNQVWQKSSLPIAEPSKSIELYFSHEVDDDVYKKCSTITS